MSLSGSKNKTSSSGTMNQTQTNYLGQPGLNAINQGLDRIGGYEFQGVTPELIGRFQNPYQQDVIDATLADINRQQQLSLQQGGDAAQMAGAFGGSRHGVADALTKEGYDRNARSQVADLRSQGYQSALQAAQNEAANQNAWQMALEQLYGNYAGLLSQHGSSSNTTGTQSSKGSSSSFGFTWSPKLPASFGTG